MGRREERDRGRNEERKRGPGEKWKERVRESGTQEIRNRARGEGKKKAGEEYREIRIGEQTTKEREKERGIKGIRSDKENKKIKTINAERGNKSREEASEKGKMQRRRDRRIRAHSGTGFSRPGTDGRSRPRIAYLRVPYQESVLTESTAARANCVCVCRRRGRRCTVGGVRACVRIRTHVYVSVRQHVRAPRRPGPLARHRYHEHRAPVPIKASRSAINFQYPHGRRSLSGRADKDVWTANIRRPRPNFHSRGCRRRTAAVPPPHPHPSPSHADGAGKWGEGEGFI